MASRYVIDSVAEFLEVVCDIRRHWTQETATYFDPWFRGHTSSGYALTPSLYRLNLGAHEYPIRRAFHRIGMNLVGEVLPPDDWAWYFVMQHHRAPTRLLDWTDGALLALLFATMPVTAGDPRVRADAAVWMLDPFWLNQQTVGIDGIVSSYSKEATQYLSPLIDGDVPLAPSLPVAMSPPHLVRRIAVQRGRFTLFGREEFGLNIVAKRRRSRLLKLVIRHDAIPRIRLDLATAGITETTIFPDLEGLSRELIRYFTEPWEQAHGIWAR
jgi:hypothetical protein